MQSDAEFVDALSSPIQFLSAAEKRAKQMQELGIEDKDITDVPNAMSKKRPELLLNANRALPLGSTGGNNLQSPGAMSPQTPGLNPQTPLDDKKGKCCFLV